MSEMRYSSIAEEKSVEGGQKLEHDVDLSGQGFDTTPGEQPQSKGSALNEILSKLTVQTGEGSVEEYMDKPLNFGKNEGQKRALARILRGLTGFLGSLDFAIIDVAIGFLELNQGGKKHDMGVNRSPGVNHSS